MSNRTVHLERENTKLRAKLRRQRWHLRDLNRAMVLRQQRVNEVLAGKRVEYRTCYTMSPAWAACWGIVGVAIAVVLMLVVGEVLE